MLFVPPTTEAVTPLHKERVCRLHSWFTKVVVSTAQQATEFYLPVIQVVLSMLTTLQEVKISSPSTFQEKNINFFSTLFR
jgi:hypothetical protein